MAGLAKLCRKYGSIKVSDRSGKTVTWVYDYKLDKPVIKQSK